MEIAQSEIAWRLQLAGILIVLGLIVELSTLAWNHALGFIVFLGIGALFIFGGVMIYLWSLASQEQTSSNVPRHAERAKS